MHESYSQKVALGVHVLAVNECLDQVPPCLLNSLLASPSLSPLGHSTHALNAYHCNDTDSEPNSEAGCKKGVLT